MLRFTLDQVISIEKNVGTLDAYGHKAKDQWALIARTRTRVMYIASQGSTEGEKEVLTDTFDFLVRSRRDYLDNEIRIIYGNYIYECLVPEQLDRSFMRIRARKVSMLDFNTLQLLSGDDLVTESDDDFKLVKTN
jgi:head-tail adaptor